jgi:hypothetical protein
MKTYIEIKIICKVEFKLPIFIKILKNKLRALMTLFQQTIQLLRLKLTLKHI